LGSERLDDAPLYHFTPVLASKKGGNASKASHTAGGNRIMPTALSGFRTVFTAPREVTLEPCEYPPPAAGKVRLRTERTLISTGTELTALTGDFPAGSAWAAYIQYPTGVGYSNAATVIDVGEGVEKVQVGDRVACTAAHATHAIHDANYLYPIPNGVDWDVAAFSTLAEIAMGGVRLSRVMFGESVVIIGAGLVGQLAIHFSGIPHLVARGFKPAFRV
jgi:threonine dehydrogenase-like Zn-dependent dehydrogenase